MSRRKTTARLDLKGSQIRDYDVGFGKPPADTRFKPGISGNPRGRPKGSKNNKPGLNAERLREIVLEEAYRDVTIRDGERNITMPMAQAVIRSLSVSAAKGNHRAQRLFAEMLVSTERQDKALHNEWLETAITYKVEWERELARRERLGLEGPAPLPHPDHVQIDFLTGTVEICGPMTKEQKAAIDMWSARKTEFEELEEELENLRAQLAAGGGGVDLDTLRSEISKTEQVLEAIRKVVLD